MRGLKDARKKGGSSNVVSRYEKENKNEVVGNAIESVGQKTTIHG